MENLINLINFVVCLAGIAICACRLGNMEDAKIAVQFHYNMWQILFWVSATSPAWLKESVSVVQLALGAGVLIQLVVGYIAIKREKDAYMRESAA